MKTLLLAVCLLSTYSGAMANTPSSSSDSGTHTPTTAKRGKITTPVDAPPPVYPYLARARHEQGSGEVTVSFDRSGHVTSATMTRSTGSGLLDKNTVSYVMSNWKNVNGKKTVIAVPITYRLKMT